MLPVRSRRLLLFALPATLVGVALAESTLQVTGYSPPIGQVSTREAWSAPQGSIWAFSTQSDLASPNNGLAQAAVSRDVIPGHESIHNPSFLNDGYYGNGSSWIGTGPDSWLKIDLGQTVLVSNVRFGRDRIGHFDDRDPGRFQIIRATSDDVYENGNDQHDQGEYRPVFDSESTGFSGQISGSQTLLATFPATEARYLKIVVGSDGAAIDEVEVWPAAEGSVATAVEPPPEADACATAPCGEFTLCTDLPGSLTTAAGRSCACATGYTDAGDGQCLPTQPVVWKMAADSRSTSTYNAMRSIASTWSQKTSGRVSAKTYSWDQLGSESAVVAKLRLGQVDAAFLTTAGLSQLSADLLVLNIPGLVRTHEERQELLTKLGPALEDALQQRGYVVLAWSELAPMHVFSTTARPTMSTLQQAKFGATGPNGWKELLVSWGLKPTVLGATDLMPGLSTGVIDALPWTTSSVYSYQAYSKVPYMSDLVWSTLDQALVIRSAAWTAVPSEWRSQLSYIAQGFSAKIPSGAAEEATVLPKLRAKGVQVVPFTDTAAWYTTLDASYSTNVRGRLVSAAVFDEARAILASFRAAPPTP